MRKKYTCIGCPMSCDIEVEIEDGKVISVHCNKCPFGEKWVRKEVENPVRTLITVLPVKDGKMDTVSVKSNEPIPMSKIPEILEILSKMEVKAPVRVGEVILHNPLGLEVDIIATRDA